MEIVDEREGLDDVRAALGRGELVVVPTDTVYGIAASAADEAAVRRLYAVKGRDIAQPTAVVFANRDELAAALPDLDVRTRWAVQSLLPGPWTLVIDAPGHGWPWLSGGADDGPLGVRVPAGAPALPPIAATSANPAGSPTADAVLRLDDALVPHVAYAIDRGVLHPDAESTVLDLTAWARREGEVRVLRDTARRAGQALAVLLSDDGP